MTCGGSHGNGPLSLYKALHSTNSPYLGSFIGNGPNNIRQWRPNLTQPEPLNQNAILETDLNKISTAIKDLSDKVHNLPKEQWHQLNQPKPSRNIGYSIIGAIATYRWSYQMFAGKKRLNVDKCTQCGRCANDFCPSGAITLNSENYPIFNEKLCQGCFACINLCPTLAIETKSGRNKHPLTTYRKYVSHNK